MKSLTIVAWILLGVVGTALIVFIPGALDLIDDARLGRLVARYFLRTAVLFGIAGVLFVGNKRRAAYALSGVVVAGYLAMATYAVFHASPARPSPTARSAVDDSAGQIAAADRQLSRSIRLERRST